MSRLKRLALNDEGFVFDPTTGESYLVNATAAAILRSVQEGVEDDALLERVAREFDVDINQVANDVGDFLLQLRELRLV